MHFRIHPQQSLSSAYPLADFIAHRRGEAGSAAAAAWLSAEEKEALMEAGASTEEVERIARAGGISRLVPEQVDERATDAVVVRLLEARAAMLRERFAQAGDVRLGTNHRVASATGEGGIAIAAIESYLKTL